MGLMKYVLKKKHQHIAIQNRHVLDTTVELHDSHTYSRNTGGL